VVTFTLAVNEENAMSDLQRRDFLTRAGVFAAVSAALGGASRAAAGDPSFMNNVPDPLVSGKELPTFKYALEKAKPKVLGGSNAREATVEEFPISKEIAGVSMRLEPGAMRELHWHATAAEWAYVNKGRVRTTVLAPGGGAETNDFDPGDVWYFPRGHGHMLECLGNEPCHFVLIFDNGYFSEFGTFSITDWIGHTPPALLAKNFGVPASTFANFPKEEAYFAKGAIPPEKAADPLGGVRATPLTHKWRLLKNDPRVNNKGGRLYLVDSTQFPISKTITGAVLELDPGALRELHWHPNADEWQYVLEGKVSMTMFGSHGRYRTEVLGQGDIGYIPQGYGHSIENVGDSPCRVLIGFNSGNYEEIDLTEWMAGNPIDVLATNFGQPASVFEKFPRKDVFIAPKEGK
jgi:oxalate decarboxylase